MATTHTYVVTQATSIGDVVTIVGTVDGSPVTVQTWLSALNQISQSQGATGVQSFVAGLMLSAIPTAPAAVTVLPPGTFLSSAVQQITP